MSFARIAESASRACSIGVCSLIALAKLLSFASSAMAEDTVRMGFLQGARREMTIADVRSTFDLWTQELGAKHQVPIKVFPYVDIVAMRQAFQSGEINAVSADAMTLARNFKLDDLAEGYAVAMAGGWNLILLAGTGSPTRNINDLAGKRIVMLEDDQTSTFYLESLCLRHYARDCSKVFAEIQRVANNNQAVLRVFFGKADLALVYRYGYELSKELNPQLEKKLGGVLGELPLTSLYFAFFSTAVDKDFRRRILRVVPTMHTYPRGRQLLDILKMDHLELADPSELKPFVQLETDYRELKSVVDRRSARK